VHGEDPVPAPGVVVTLVDDECDAMDERGDDAVRHAGDPAGVGSAPVHVLGVQIERVHGRGVMGDDRFVDFLQSRRAWPGPHSGSTRR
jgi:hypothetical protein